MRTWCAKLGLIAGGLVGLGGLAAPAPAQLPGGNMCGPGCYSPQLQQPADATAACTLPNDGSPNAFSEYQDPCCWKEPMVWASAEYLLGITRRSPLGVPLVTTSGPNAAAGTLAPAQPNTVVLFGLQGLDLQDPQGMRFTVGVSPTRDWLVPLEVVYTYLHQRTNAFSDESDAKGNPLLARPVFSTQPGHTGETSFLSSSPGQLAGGVNIDASLQLWGLQAVALVRTSLQWGDDCGGCAIDLPIGFRYLNLNEVLNITSSAKSLSANSPVHYLGASLGVGNQTIVTDMFKGNNEFVGGEFGIRLESRMDRWSLTLEPRVSIGATTQLATIAGVSDLNPANGGAQKTTPDGILAVASNSGRHAREEFTALPEATAGLAWQCFPWMRIQAGYNITYWPNVQRPGTEVNPAVDVRQVPTSAAFSATATSSSPSCFFKDSTFLMQDFSLGVVFSY